MFSPSLCRSLAAALCAAFVCQVGFPTGAAAAGSKKRDPIIAIRFHAQVSGYDPSFAAKVKVGNPPQELTIEKIPSLSERDVASFYPYRASDGSYSVVLKLDRHGEAILEALSSDKRGMLLVAAVNGRPVSTLLIDKIITDGIIFIPSGLNVADIRALGASFSIMGQTDADKEKRKEPPKSTSPISDSELPTLSQHNN